MRDARDTVRWIADACDGDARDEARIIPVQEAIEDFEVFYGPDLSGQSEKPPLAEAANQ
jgi:hypothetical protein